MILLRACVKGFQKTGIPLFEGLERTVDTPALYKLDAHERKDVLKDVFSITKMMIVLKTKPSYSSMISIQRVIPLIPVQKL